MLRLTFLLIISPLFLLAQNGNSPYSRNGLGDPLTDEYVSNMGMGGIGVSVPTPFNININPAFLPHNRYTTFEFGISGEYKKIRNQQASVTDGNGGLRYLAFAFPITQKYTLSLGLRPLTNVSYNYSNRELVQGSVSAEDPDGDTVSYRYFGEGGLNSIYLSQGLQITDYLSLGLRTSYNFGNIQKSNSSFVENVNQPYFLQSNNQTNYRGFTVAPSIGFRTKMNKDWYVNAGGVFEVAAKWNYTNSILIQKVSIFDDSQLDESPLGEEVTGKVSYPTSFSTGLSFEKLRKLTLGSEYRYQNWSKFQPIEGSESLKNISSFSVGGQYIPNMNALKGYLNRVIYRFGAYYSQSTFTSSEQKLNDFGGTLGLSLPVGRLSFVNLGFSAGKRGARGTNLVQENYVRFNLGVTLNDRWFIRSKFD